MATGGKPNHWAASDLSSASDAKEEKRSDAMVANRTQQAPLGFDGNSAAPKGVIILYADEVGEVAITCLRVVPTATTDTDNNITKTMPSPSTMRSAPSPRPMPVTAAIMIASTLLVMLLSIATPAAGFDDAFSRWYLELVSGDKATPLPRKDGRPSIRLSYRISKDVSFFRNARLKMFTGDKCDEANLYTGRLMVISDMDEKIEPGTNSKMQIMDVDILWKQSKSGAIPLGDVQFCIRVSIFTERDSQVGVEKNFVDTVVWWDLSTNEATLSLPSEGEAIEEGEATESDGAADSDAGTAEASDGQEKTDGDGDDNNDSNDSDAEEKVENSKDGKDGKRGKKKRGGAFSGMFGRFFKKNDGADAGDL